MRQAPQTPDAGEVARAVERVLARPEFAEAGAPGFLQLVRDLWAAARQWLASAFLSSMPEGLVPWLPWLLLALLLAAAVWAIVRLVQQGLAGRTRGSPPERVTAATLSGPRDPAWWEEAARAAAAAGRFREAAHALYLAVVLRLDERGVLRFHAGKTPGDYRRETGGHPARAPFDAFVRAFLPLAFGAAPPDAERFRQLSAAAGEVAADA